MKIPKLPTLLFFLLAHAAFAAIGEPPEELLAAVAEHRPAAVEGGYELAAGVTFRAELSGGAVRVVTGDGTLTPEGTAVLADLIGAATGYGTAIAEPVATFLETRAFELAGQGRVPLGLEEYVLELEVTGTGPLHVEFRLALQEVPAAYFPEPAHTLGPEDAPYVIREFSDFQCPFCARYNEVAMPFVREELLARGDVRFEFHHFPLQSIHANALPAAEAAECVAAANGEDAFWAYADALFERQQAWQGLGDPSPYFVRLAQDIGLSADGVASCLEERTYLPSVQEAYGAAVSTLRLSGTPSVFLNGFRVRDFLEPGGYLRLIELVDAFGAAE